MTSRHTTRRWILAVVIPAFIVLASCAKTSPKNDVGAPVTAVAAKTSSSIATTAGSTTTTAAVAGDATVAGGTSTENTVASVPAATPAPGEPDPATINPAATSTPTAPEPASVAQFVITVGTDSGPQRRQDAAKGSLVTISVTNPNAADEFHLHGYDLELKAGKGEAVTFSFTATQPGTFELESHATGGVLFVLRVA
jgi:hypothetical protein